MELSEPPKKRAEIVNDCQKCMGRFDEDDLVTYVMFTSYQGSIDEFLILRRAVWSDSRFYHPDFSRQRMRIAVGIACNYNYSWVAPAICRSVLGLDNGTAKNNLNFCIRNEHGYTFLHGLAMKIGLAHGTEDAREWHIITRDVLRHLMDIRDLSQTGFVIIAETEVLIASPLSLLISEWVKARMSEYRRHVTTRIRPADSTAVLAGCEDLIFSWLIHLYHGGIDLELYGENEMEHSRNGHFPARKTYSWLYESDSGHGYSVRLISFQYSRLPTIWKFWWSEHSDEFAEDFWCLIESDSPEAVMDIPEGWVD